MKRIFTDCHLVSAEGCVSQSSGYDVQKSMMIAVENGVITAIGKDLPTDGFDLISLENRLVTPGLIDCHTHLVFAGDRAKEREQRLNGMSYAHILANGGGILATVSATRKASADTLLDLAIPRAKALISDGVTTVEIKSGYGLTMGDEIKMLRVAKRLQKELPINVKTTLLAAHTVPPEFRDSPEAYVDTICNEMIPEVASMGLADAVDVFCEGIGFTRIQMERVFESALIHGLAIKGHTEQLSDLGGSECAANMGALSVDHIEYINLKSIESLAANGTIATLLPGAFYFLNETQKPPVNLLRKHGVPMAVATDFNPGTSPFASLTLMMNMASTLFGLTPKETFFGVTNHAARALGTTNIGQIQPGFDADFSVWDLTSPAQLSYQIGLSPLHSRYLKGEFANDC
ncbi:imidazolonepropionase [Enterovibrio nigricans]|uniref:Imidazolonepropionase n=1 Tax=Enterovibrio nigricans DSM 22720 TaxID=1121868 RepID=A0A1T4VNH6_9GAMM|nr:imidazolonepropionase [Enterovibrio nigricans]PKF49564.1 imidazolonepropionase [Enterovibrio nigricans]SKA66523.1 imidazolonepropionase [Enterovibrio nigricans DSM 22720]